MWTGTPQGLHKILTEGGRILSAALCLFGKEGEIMLKRLIGILVSMSMVVSFSVPAFAAPGISVFAAEEDSEESEPTGDTDKIHYIDDLSLELSYDDRYDLSDLGEGISRDEEYVIYQTEYAEGQGITSYQVSQGTRMEETDEALLTLQAENGVDTEVIATGVGSGTIWLVRADQEEDLRKALEGGEEPDDENPDNESPEEVIDVYKIAVTIEPAALTLMFLAGQSNMEGYCDSYTGYEIGDSIVCEEGQVYSTYVPWGTSKGKEITGIDFTEVCSTSNYNRTAGDFVAGSLQGAVTEEGVLDAPSNMTGGLLEYPLNSLTDAGGGKTGPDSGLAYEWNQLTGDKVWVVNTAYGSTEILQWTPGGNCYNRSVPVWDDVLETYQAEIAAGHYTEGSRLAFWLQGEMGDATSPVSEYEDSFDSMYQAMSEELDMDAFGIFMVRAGYATNRGAEYRSEKDIKMSSSRIAQYWLGSGLSPYSNVVVASNANEQWVSNTGVASYFQSRYGKALSYPTQGGSSSVPTTVNEVHYDIHYSQIGHNENGITAADGMYEVLNGSSTPSSVAWRGADGQEVSSLTLELSTDTAIAVPVVDPVYTAKQLTEISETGDTVSYDAAAGTVQAVSESAVGKGTLTASAGRATASLSVTISVPVDLSGVAGPDYTGLYLYDGVWWYLENGIIQSDYEGLAENENGVWYVQDGRVDLSYTGFAKVGDDCWYVEGGKVTLETNSVIKDTTGAIGTSGTWYYVVGSKVQTDFTGLANYKNENGWWYIVNGVVDFSYTGLEKNKNGWYYVIDGKVDFFYTGFAENSNGKWYVEDGKVTFNTNSVIKDTPGAIGKAGTWYYVVGSEVQSDFTGLAHYKNANGWWYIENGVVNFNYAGFAENQNGKWYLEGGKVTFTKQDILKDAAGALGEKGAWYYIIDSKVQTSFTGLGNFKNSNGWWYIVDGKVDFTHNGVDKNINGWWYVLDGKVQFGFTGLANYRNANGWWYIVDGKVDFTHNGVDRNINGWWYVLDGKVQFGFTGLANYRNANGWWYIQDGKVDFSFTGIAQNANGWWYIQDGKVDFSYTGSVAMDDGITYSVMSGEVLR